MAHFLNINPNMSNYCITYWTYLRYTFRSTSLILKSFGQKVLV